MTGPRPILYNGLGQPQGIWETRTAPTVNVGTRGMLSDGRVFHYARNNSATTIIAGVCLSAEVASVDMDDMVTDTHAVGSFTVNVTPVGSKTYAANELAEGFLCSNSGSTGQGIGYKIKSHPATSTTTEFVVTLYDPLAVALDSTAKTHVVKNIWMDPVIAPTSNQGVAAGATQVAVGAGDTDPVFYWAQTWGPACVLADSASNVGDALMNATTAGETLIQTAGSIQIAEAYTLGVDADYVMAYLRVAP